MKSRQPRLLLLLVALLLAAFGGRPASAGKRPVFQAPPHAPVARLLSPAHGEVWTAGSPVAIEWQPGPGLEMLPYADEWEAFLSVDGGRTYPLRITPHLDRTLRRFVLEVPRLPTGQARLLLRFGDERREVESEMPAVFTIVDGPVSSSLPPRPALRRGEPARERDGDRGVVAWVEGPRDGRQAYTMEAGGRPISLRGIAAGHPFPLFLAGGTAAGSVLLHRPAPAEEEDLARRPPPGSARPSRPEPPPTSGGGVRLLIHRFNE